MARVKSPSARGHRKIKKLAKGYVAARRRRFKVAHEAVLHAGQYAYHGRKLKKRNLRSLWILRINAATRAEGHKYSDLIKAMNDKKVELDRKVLSDIAATDSKSFSEIVKFIFTSR